MMEEGVTYMMMGEDGVEQATQLVALQAEDGSQQLAVPVIDPHTGQETYMILDQNSLEGEDGQLLIVGEGEAATLVHGGEGAGLVEEGGSAYTVAGGGEVGTLIGCEGGLSLAQDENGMIVLPPGANSLHTNTNSVVTTSEPLVQVQIPEEFQQHYVSSQIVTEKPQVQGIQKLSSATTLSVNSTTVNVPVPYTTTVSSVTGGSGSAVPVRKNSFISVPARSSTLDGARENQHNQGGVKRESDTYVPVKQEGGRRESDTFDSRRQPRKQNLSEFTSNQDHGSGESISRGPPPGLSGDPVQDGLKVDRLLEKVMKNYTLNCDEREDLRTKIFANGLGEGKKYLSKYSLKRARDLGLRKERKPKPPRFIKCDQCDTRFPSDVEESKLFAHVLNFHMAKEKPNQQTESTENVSVESKPEPVENPPIVSKSPSVLNKSPVKSYIDPDQADNIGPQLYRCSDCLDGFLTIKSLLDHQKSKHGKCNSSPVSKQSPQLVSQSLDNQESQHKQSVNERLKEAVLEATLIGTGEVNTGQTQIIPEHSPSSPSKQKVEVIRKLADEWDDEDEDTQHETLNEIIPKVDKEKLVGLARCESRTESVKSETLEDISREVAGIKEDAAKGKLNEAAATTTTTTTTVTTPKKKGVRRKGDSEDEAKIVADVDDILSDTDALIANVSSTVINTPQHLKKVAKTPSNAELKATKKRQSAPPPALKPLPTTGVDVVEEPPAKKRPTAQCDECFELFEDEEKLAWHALQDH